MTTFCWFRTLVLFGAEENLIRAKDCFLCENLSNHIIITKGWDFFIDSWLRWLGC